MFRFSLRHCMLAVALVALVVALMLQSRSAGTSAIVSSLVPFPDGKTLAALRLDEEIARGELYVKQTVSIIDIASKTTTVVVEVERLKASSAGARWFYDSPLIGHSRDEHSLAIKGDYQWRRYTFCASQGTFQRIDSLDDQVWDSTEIAMNQASETYVIWDAKTGLAALWLPAWWSSQLHNQLVAHSVSHDRFAISNDDATAIKNSRCHAFSPVGHVLAIQDASGVRVCDFDLGVSKALSCPPAQCLAFSPDGEKLAIATTKSMLIVDLRDEAQGESLEHNDKVASMAWAGDTIALGDFCGGLTLWNPAAGPSTTRIKVAGPSYAVRIVLYACLLAWALVVIYLARRRLIGWLGSGKKPSPSI